MENSLKPLMNTMHNKQLNTEKLHKMNIILVIIFHMMEYIPLQKKQDVVVNHK